jgi:hypothetical protein
MSCSGISVLQMFGLITDPFAGASNRPRPERRRIVQAISRAICVEALVRRAER